MKKLLICLLSLFIFTACGGVEKHVVNARGFSELKDSYRPGENVRIIYDKKYIASDTQYKFFVDDIEVNPTWDDDIGYILEFKMPSNDVNVRTEKINTSVVIENPNITEMPVKILYRRLWAYGLDVDIVREDDIAEVVAALNNVVISDRITDIQVDDFTDVIILYYADDSSETYIFEEYYAVIDKVHYEVDSGLGELRAILTDIIERKE